MTTLHSLQTAAKSICNRVLTSEKAASKIVYGLVAVLCAATVSAPAWIFIAQQTAQNTAFTAALEEVGSRAKIGSAVTIRYVRPGNIHRFVEERKVRITDTWWKMGKDGLAFCAAGVSETGELSACVRPEAGTPSTAPAPKVGG